MAALERRHILVVDDGSAAACAPVFAALAAGGLCALYRCPRNAGKGAALKTGFQEALRLWPECAGIVTADADGQHSAADVAKICAALEDHPDSLILGVRDFDAPQVPARSRRGNKFTSAVFRLFTGRVCPDTQTGLRGLPRASLPVWANIPGSRYEYEMNVLFLAARTGTPFVEVRIATLYQDDNASSHFHVWRDSFQIFLVMVKFGISSMLSAFLDFTLFTLLASLSGDLSSAGVLRATALARVLSGTVNYLLNRKWVFSAKGDAAGQTVKYVLLFCFLLLASWKMVDIIHAATGWHIAAVKILTDSFLFFLSFTIQTKFVFARR
jgi:glycosyltransferase involved in cell wall biosynthesis